MTQTKTPVATARVPASDTVTPCPNPATARGLDDTRYSVQTGYAQSASLADLRSPADCYHPEAYLIGCLVKLYGWRVIEPGVLRRRWNGVEAAAGQRIDHRAPIKQGPPAGPLPMPGHVRSQAEHQEAA